MRIIIAFFSIVLFGPQQVLAAEVEEDVIAIISKVWKTYEPINVSGNILVITNWAKSSGKKDIVMVVDEFNNSILKVNKMFKLYDKVSSVQNRKNTVKSIESMCLAYNKMNKGLGTFQPIEVVIASTDINQPIEYIVKRLKDAGNELNCHMGWNSEV